MTDPLSLLAYDAFILNPKRNPMIPLEQKLVELKLRTMSHQLETTLSEAATKNLSRPPR